MSGIRLFSVGILTIALGAALPAGAVVKMYQGKWVADSFGNDKVGGGTAPESDYFSALNNPQGVLCNGGIPICNIASSPVTAGTGMAFNALGPNCTPYTVFGPARPTAKGKTETTGGGFVSTMGVANRTPPLYRNAAFFTAGGAANNMTSCAATTTMAGAKALAYLSPFDTNRGIAQYGAPLAGSDSASVNTGVSPAAFTFAAAPATGTAGMRFTGQGSFSNTYPYLYSYTYRTLRNDAGSFKAGGGFFNTASAGTFVLPYKQGANTVGKAVVKAGKNKFGGVMKLLGTEAGKVCYFNNGGCSLGGFDWRYRFAGNFTTTYKATKGWAKSAKYATVAGTQMYYNTAGMQSSTVNLDGWRFPWTTGTVTVTATGRGPHNTIEQRKGKDMRDSKGEGTIQLVTPIITRWLQPSTNFETSGVGVLRLVFAPEPQNWAMLVAGLSMLTLLYRARGR